MNRETIDTWLERAILVAVLAVLTLGTLALGGVRPFEFSILCGLTMGAAFLWLVRLWAAPKFRFLWPPVCWAILPFVAYSIWRWRTADIRFAAGEEVIQTVLCAILFLTVINNLYSQESVRLLSLALIFLAMAVAMYGIYQWLRQSDTVWGLPRPIAYYGRASGTFICPNHFAGFLEMILPLALSLVFTGRVSPVLRICLGYAAIVIFVGIAAAQSRAGWIAGLAGITFVLLMLLRTRGKRWIAIAGLAALALVSQWLYTRSVQKRVVGTELAGHGREIRLRLWASAWQMWKLQPWVGVGPNHFDYRYGAFREPVDRTQGRPGRAHNDYLNTLADYGAVGLVLALVPLALGAWTIQRCWPYVQRSSSDLGQKKSNRTAIVLGTAGGLIAIAIHSAFDFNMHVPSNAFVAITLLAVACGHVRFATERYWVTARWPVRIAGTLVLGGTLAWLAPQSWTRVQKAALVRKADKLADGSNEKIALLQKAFALTPDDFETAFSIGAQLRGLAWVGDPESDRHARDALKWYQRVIDLNKWHVQARAEAGMCLDWLGQHDEATPYFQKALELDPNHWQTRAMMGWHEFQMDHFEKARDWMLESFKLNWTYNSLAKTYLEAANKKIARENAATHP